MPKKLTARQFLAQYPDAPLNQNCLEDMACPKCGQRERFRIEITCRVTLFDDGTDDDDDDGDTAMCPRRQGPRLHLQRLGRFDQSVVPIIQMKILIQAHSNNEHWSEAECILVELTPELVALLRKQARKASRFLKRAGSIYYGHVCLESPVDFSAGPLPDPEPTFANKTKAEPWQCVNDDFEFKDPARTECHCVRYFVGTTDSLWLTALSKDSGDRVEAELTSNLLKAVVSQNY